MEEMGLDRAIKNGGGDESPYDTRGIIVI